ncbi:hypothetical protein F4827_001060 [Paraburkholderia bannensis]|uniref:DUF4240 domain-containing protein n=1 Tax=Paraburkholderia bannensis TaxID=765414 RepID=A0A7W9WR67_9BURK|nr:MULTISPECIES: DUF4240 domain-containing protein [Paraburkholderia]MBB3256234.1 hypothetical protein [Paraburkholderia sp. WP4_3_2]MBB6101234.1 hypothetical protein [Paraburkholderia bannensis]
MNIDKFWEIVDQCKDFVNPEVALEDLLSELSPEDIAEFFYVFCRLEAYAYSETMWCAAYLLNGGCSDDGFEYFRRGLISKGRAVYELALKNPDDLVCLWGQGDIRNESFGHAAPDAYMKKTGLSVEEAYDYLYGYKRGEVFELHIDGQLFERKPQTQSWDFDDEQENRKRLPRLTDLSSQQYECQLAQWAAIGGIAA